MSEWVEVLNNQGSIGNLITRNEKFELVHLSLDNKSVIPLHALPMDVTFFFLEGNPIFNFEGTEKEFIKGDTIFCPENKMRSWINKKDQIAKLLVIKTLG